MASLIHDKNGTRRVQFVDAEKKRRTIRLGKLPKKASEAFRLRVEHLASAQRAGVATDGQTADWLRELPGAMHERLVRVGLAEPREALTERTLGELWDAYLDGLTVKASTMTAYRQAADAMLDYFGADTPLDSLSEPDAIEWRRWLSEDRGWAPATVARRVRTAGQAFARALRWDWIDTDPFAELKGGPTANPDRRVFINREDFARLLDACPDNRWRLILSLARFGGLRVPSELEGLRWSGVNWDEGWFTVVSPKKAADASGGRRRVPIFPEIREALLQAFEQAHEGEDLIFAGEYGLALKNMRTQLQRLCDRAGVSRWPKAFQNMRASRASELVRDHAAACATAWLGHSPTVAARHYWSASPEDFRRAAGLTQNAAHLTAHNAAQHPSAPDCSDAQPEQQTSNGKGFTLDRAPECDTMRNAKVGVTGLEPVTSAM